MRNLLYLLVFLGCLTSCSKHNEYLVRVPEATASYSDGPYAYVNQNGDTIVPNDKYVFFYTDTIFHVGFVVNQKSQLIGINTKGEELFEVFVYDNGPDYPSEGLFRILENGKIGYANENGNVIIKPQYSCAFPFENGKAKVSFKCDEVRQGEHFVWKSEDWFYIDRNNNKLTTE